MALDKTKITMTLTMEGQDPIVTNMNASVYHRSPIKQLLELDEESIITVNKPYIKTIITYQYKVK